MPVSVHQRVDRIWREREKCRRGQGGHDVDTCVANAARLYCGRINLTRFVFNLACIAMFERVSNACLTLYTDCVALSARLPGIRANNNTKCDSSAPNESQKQQISIWFCLSLSLQWIGDRFSIFFSSIFFDISVLWCRMNDIKRTQRHVKTKQNNPGLHHKSLGETQIGQNKNVISEAHDRHKSRNGWSAVVEMLFSGT